MLTQFARLSKEQLAAVHAAASELFDLIESDRAVSDAFSRSFKLHLTEIVIDTEEALAKVDPLVDRQPVIVVTEALAVQ